MINKHAEQILPGADTVSATRRPIAAPARPARLDPKRYRRVNWFFWKLTWHLVWWDVILNRRGLRRFRPPLLPRWRRLAQEYRQLASELGGVLIKLGQFLSTRVDVLPAEVTQELAGLQDEVPPEPLEHIIGQLEADFGGSIAPIFAWISPEAVGSASLAQAHRARLVSGKTGVVKVLRPQIEVLIETDLLAFKQVVRRLKYYKPISNYVDLDWLAEEFTTVTRKELDFVAEGHNAERFAQDFADDPQVYVPRIFWDYTAAHTLAMEDVTYIRIDDFAALSAVGIERAKVARKLFNLYLEQFFVTHFIHADPHAGNLFVRPLYHPDELGQPGDGYESLGFAPGATVPHYPDRPFQIVFIDFGMAVSIPERLQAALREYVIGVGLRDARRIVRAYVIGGMLLPHADLEKIEQATEAQLERFWGSFLGQFKDIELDQYGAFFMNEYRDLIHDAPFQLQADMLFIFRALGILSGMAAKLDPDFDPWTEAAPFARRLAQDEFLGEDQSWRERAVNLGQVALTQLKRLDEVLRLAQQGRLAVRVEVPAETKKMLHQIKQATDRQVWVQTAAGLFIGGVLWHASNLIASAMAGSAQSNDFLGLGFMGLAAVSFLWGMLKKG